MVRNSLAANLLAAMLALALFCAGALAPLERAIDDARFRLTDRKPSGSIVLVDIDAASLSAVGTWPWNRAIHGRLVDRLRALGADDIALDVDFSTRSTPEGDAAFEAALRRADGMVMLAALQQRASAREGETALTISRPLPQFAAEAWEGSVDVWPDPDGSVRTFTRGEQFGSTHLASLAALLSGTQDVSARPFQIDFGIDAKAFDHISAIDVLDGRIAASKITGKKVLVGATAVELRDYFEVPRFRFIPGSLLQAVAAESIMQNRDLRPLNLAAPLCLFAVLLAALCLLRPRLTLRRYLVACAGLAITIEAGAILIQIVWPIVPGTALLHAELVLLGATAIANEIEERRIRVLASRSSEARMKVILDRVVADNFAGIIVVDESGHLRAISKAATDLLGLQPDCGMGEPFARVLPPPLSLPLGEALARARDARWVPEPPSEAVCMLGGVKTIFECVTTVSQVPGPVLRNGRAAPDTFAVCLTFQDVTEKRNAEAQIAAMALSDALTGLPNRRAFLRRLEQALTAAGQGTTDLKAVLFFDLDRFKIVNDRLGHAGGDELLQAVAERVRRAAESADFAARLGGDEFALLIMRPSLAEACGFAERLLQVLDGLYELGPYQMSVGVSIGLAPSGGSDASGWMKNADAALQVAKRSGGGCVKIFDASMEEAAEAGKALEQDLRDGLRRGEFEVHYQRQIDLSTDQIVGVEALIRWNHPRLGAVSPTTFIPAAERTGFIETLGAWVLQTACTEAASWPEPIAVSVNLSAVQLSRGDLAQTVADALRETGLAPGRLDLELTESLLMENDDHAREMLSRVRQLGVGLSLDDFGTGYSSLAYLKTFDVDKIKIDRSFVRDLPDDLPSAAIIRAIVSLAQSLNLRVNAEGIETMAQLDALRRLGCNEVQGFIHGRPEPSPAIAASLLQQRGSRSAAVRLAS